MSRAFVKNDIWVYPTLTFNLCIALFMLNYGWSDWIGRNDIVLFDLCHQMCNLIFGLIYLLSQKKFERVEFILNVLKWFWRYWIYLVHVQYILNGVKWFWQLTYFVVNSNFPFYHVHWTFFKYFKLKIIIMC